MKATHSLIFLLALLISLTAKADPFIQASHNRFDAETEFTLNFDKAMVPAEQVTKEANDLKLNISPNLKHRLIWITRSQAMIEFLETPKPATDYVFSLDNKLKHQDGSLVPEMPRQQASTPGFALSYGTRLTSSSPSIRQHRYFVRFNLAVDPKSVSKFLIYRSDEKKEITAKVSSVTAGELDSQYYSKPTWDQEFAIKRGELPAEFSDQDRVPGGLIVSPSVPLPLGQNWRLVLKQGLPAKDYKLGLGETETRYIGSISPLKVTSASAEVMLDSPRCLAIQFNSLLAEYTPEQLAKLITLNRKLGDSRYEQDGSSVRIYGDFSIDSSWTIRFSPELSSADGLELIKTEPKQVRFFPLVSQLTLPGYDHGLFAKGTRSQEILAVNMRDCRIRIKRLNTDQLPLALQAYRHYKNAGPHYEEVMNGVALPYELIPGEQVFDQDQRLDQALDTSKYLKIDWDQISGSEVGTGAYFVQLNGTGSTRGKRVCTQAIVQLTDIGLGWKFTEREALIYAYSCDTGLPLEGVELRIAGTDGKVLHQAISDASGTASFPRSDEDYYLIASKGEDRFGCAFSGRVNSVAMWRFPVRFSWHAQPETERKVFLFSDRSLYRPSEEVHVKGILRNLAGNDIQFAPDQEAQLTLSNARGQTLVDETIRFSEKGSFDRSFKLPEDGVGTYQVRVHFPRPEGEEAPEGWYENWVDEQSRTFDHHFLVGEFRRNAFEIKSQVIPLEPGDKTFEVNLEANYYQGQPVANAPLTWFYRTESTGFYPEAYRDFLFGDHREYDSHYWYHYFGYRDSSFSNSRSKSENGELELDDQGRAKLSLNVPESDFPTPIKLSLDSEVIDSNDQTLSHQSSALSHPVDTYLGIKRVDSLARVGDVIELPVVAVDYLGKALNRDLEATISVERHWTEKSATVNQQGRKQVVNEKKSAVVSTSNLSLIAGKPTAFRFEPTESGKHIISLTATDSEGREIRTASRVMVYGDNQYPWAYEAGMRIKLVPEKTRFTPGETARILVQTPIEGTALISIERDKVIRSFTQKLSTDQPIIEIPLEHADAPNVFVSVMLVRGAADSLKQVKEPELKLGYCELFIDNQKQRLQVNLDQASGSKRPGEAISLSGSITDSNGKPAAGAEVVLYAEDEGVLSVMGYDNPDPMAYFYEPRFLRVSAGTSLDEFLSEDPANRDYSNKGFFVGGGGFGQPQLDGEVRKDFNPCAIWAPKLVTDANGRFEVSYLSPDTLTRYRIIAVALHGENQFGTGTSDVTISKPMMLEAADPRFASEGDRLEAKVSLTNASEFEGVWTVSLKTGESSLILDGEGSQSASRELRLTPGQRAEVNFPVLIKQTGNATWTWTATPKSIEKQNLSESMSRELSDAMRSEFPVTFPMPLLRERQLSLANQDQPEVDLLRGFSPELLSGRGTIELELSHSQLVRAKAAGEYLLSYPYGCIEQTTSALMPWLTLSELSPYVPAFAAKTEAQQKSAIDAGVRRILSMQTPNGGFSYWPGELETSEWSSSYAALGLVLAKAQGAEVPQDAIDGFCNYLKRNFAEEPRDSWQAQQQARALWVLALAGQPDIAYQNKLAEKAAFLGVNGRAFLALAMAEQGDDASKQAGLALIRGKFAEPQSNSWMAHQPKNALTLLALCHLDAPSEEIEIQLDQLFARSNARGHWRTTWFNSWALQALAAVARNEAKTKQSSRIELVIGKRTETIELNQQNRSQSFTVSLDELSQLKLTCTEGKVVTIANLEAKPELSETAARPGTSGMTITRRYQRLLADGTLEPLENPKVGDLVQITLSLRVPAAQHYLAIDDPIPACFEIVNDQFASQAAGGVDARIGSWSLSHRELRDDRAVFFFNYISSKGGEDISYLARITRAGAATAPSAKAEPMYEPEKSALSTSTRLEVAPR